MCGGGGKYDWQRWGSCCRDKANCPHMGPGPKEEMPSVGGGVFLREFSRVYTSFGENHGKLRTAKWTSATEDRTWRLPSSSSSTGTLSH